MSCGIRWADTTSASWATSNSASASAAACITGQSESEPITIPTRAVVYGSLTVVSQVSSEPRGRVPRAFQTIIQVVAVGVDVADLPAGAQLLAVEVHAQRGVPGEHVRIALKERARGGSSAIRAAEDVDHHRPSS